MSSQRTVTLRGSGIHTTALGFGTASLMGKLGRTESMRLLAVAYDCGIRHFDTAPSYGYGESESVLGDFLRCRSDVTVATKFGLLGPRAGSFAVRNAKAFARPLLRVFPSLRAKTRTLAQARGPTRTFDATAAARSLAKSLKRLRRDYVDIFLLHECRAADLHDDRLLEFLLLARERGHIKAFGIGTDIATIRHSVDVALPYANVVQFANNPDEPNLEDSPALAARAGCITHTPFGGIGAASRLPPTAAFAYATARNPAGIVLFGSQKVQHVIDNALAFA